MKDTLYVHRKVLNPVALLDWMQQQGFRSPVRAGGLHVTQMFSRVAIEWDAIPPNQDELVLPATTQRRLVLIGHGKGEALALALESDALHARWAEFRKAGCSWDYPAYTPHISLSYKDGHLAPQDITPFMGEIVLGGEVYAPVSPEWL